MRKRFLFVLFGWIALVVTQGGVPTAIAHEGHDLAPQDTSLATQETYVDSLIAKQGVVEVVLKEWKFVPNILQVKPGTTTFLVHNKGRNAHGFSIEGHGINVKTANVKPGRSARLKVTFKEEGEYQIKCLIRRHDKRGMTGTLQVHH